MKNMSRTIIVMMLSILLLGSCNLDNSGASVVFDASALTGEPVSVKSGTQVVINSMDPTKMYAVRHTETGNPKSITRNGNGDDKAILQIGSSNIPIADSNNTSSFKASDVGIRNSGFIDVIELVDNPSNDFVVLENEDYLSYFTDEQYPVYEQYWHIDTDRFKELGITDPSRVIVGIEEWGSGAGSTNWGYVSLDGGYVNTSHSDSFYDFTGLDFINLYCAMTVKESYSPWGTRLILCNPLELEEGVAVSPRHATEWFTIDKKTPGEKWVIECNTSEPITLTGNINLKTVEGINKPSMPRLENTNTKTVFWVGEIEEELILEIQFWNNDTPFEMLDEHASVKVRKATEAEIADYQKNHVIGINGEALELKFKGMARDTDISFINESDTPLNNWTVEIQMRNEDGSWYEGEYAGVYMKTLHDHGVGFSGNGANGPYVKFRFGESDILDKFTIENNIPETVTLSIKLWKDPENGRDEHHIYILHGQEVKDIEDISYDDYKLDFTIPDYAGASKVLINGCYENFGETVRCYGNSTCVLPISSK